MDEFLERYKNDLKTQSVILHKFNKKYEEVCNELIKKDTQLKEIEAKYNEKVELLESEVINLKEKARNCLNLIGILQAEMQN